jgi:hypothetical protein
MELHPLLSQLDKKDFERYMTACKEDLIVLLEDLGLNNDLALQVLVDVGASLLNNDTFLLLRPFDVSTSFRASTERFN